MRITRDGPLPPSNDRASFAQADDPFLRQWGYALASMLADICQYLFDTIGFRARAFEIDRDPEGGHQLLILGVDRDGLPFSHRERGLDMRALLEHFDRVGPPFEYAFVDHAPDDATVH